MSNEEPVEEKGKKKRVDHTEVEFELGNLEFEAKGRSVVVERMFKLLLEKIESGKLVAEFKLQNIDEEEEEEEEFEEETLPETDLSEEIEELAGLEAPKEPVEPPPSWDMLETEEPEVSDAEREELNIE
ncbi:MAG: hypothetical protein ACTSV3_05080 [Candidatus Thorarchaeota archaeon]|nr:MAG: hypothetical protein DRP09_01645 [Candidatus Thorarchaeota archaeon]